MDLVVIFIIIVVGLNRSKKPSCVCVHCQHFNSHCYLCHINGGEGLYPNLLIILRWISQMSNQMLLPRNVEKLSKLNLTHCGGFCGLLPKQWRIGRPTGTVDCLTNVNKLGAVADRIISEHNYQHNLFTNMKLFLAICQIYF